MGSSVAGESRAEPYTAEVDGRKIRCESLSDALALKLAEHTATAGNLGPCESLLPEQLVEVARKYGFDAIADAIEELL